MTLKDVMPRVERGAQWLDQAFPGWDLRINLSALAMDSNSQCILSQTIGTTNIWALYPEGTLGKVGEMHRMFGMAAMLQEGTPEGNATRGAENALLKQAWTGLIQTRRAVLERELACA